MAKKRIYMQDGRKIRTQDKTEWITTNDDPQEKLFCILRPQTIRDDNNNDDDDVYPVITITSLPPTRSNKLNCSKGNSININFLLLLIVVCSVVVVFVHAKSRLPIRNNDCQQQSNKTHNKPTNIYVRHSNSCRAVCRGVCRACKGPLGNMIFKIIRIWLKKTYNLETCMKSSLKK